MVFLSTTAGISHHSLALKNHPGFWGGWHRLQGMMLQLHAQVFSQRWWSKIDCCAGKGTGPRGKEQPMLKVRRDDGGDVTKRVDL